MCPQDPGGLPAAQWDDSDPGVSPWGHAHHHQTWAVQGGQEISSPSPPTGGDVLHLCQCYTGKSFNIWSAEVSIKMSINIKEINYWKFDGPTRQLFIKEKRNLSGAAKAAMGATKKKYCAWTLFFFLLPAGSRAGGVLWWDSKAVWPPTLPALPQGHWTSWKQRGKDPQPRDRWEVLLLW